MTIADESAKTGGLPAGNGSLRKRPNISILAPAAALAWCIAVIAAYYAFNHSYYGQKISVFARFLIGLVS